MALNLKYGERKIYWGNEGLLVAKLDATGSKPVAKNIDLGWGMSVTLTKKNGMIFANGTTTPSGNAGATGGFNIGVKVPEGFRPRLNNEAIIKAQGNNNQWGSYLVAADGNVRIVSGGMNVGYTFHVSGAWVAE